MRNFYRLMLGAGSVYAQRCLAEGFVGTDFDFTQDLSAHLQAHDDWRAFNTEMAPIYLKNHPGKSRIAAGLACGATWTVAKGIAIGDVVLCPNGDSRYLVGEVTGPYQYAPGDILPHRRPVHWFEKVIDRSALSEALKRSTGSIGTVGDIRAHRDELEQLLAGAAVPKIIATDSSIEDPTTFALERHLEDFLVANWSQTELGHEYEIYKEDGQLVGQQFPTDTGPIDILAVSKDKKRLLIVELKRGRASDAVVGQILRYMGFVRDEVAEPDQVVEGVIIALDDDQRVRRALAMVPQVRFYRYEVRFKLIKA